MKRLILAAILFLLPFSAQAGFPEGKNGYDLKKIEESFRLPCDEIGNDDCIARAFFLVFRNSNLSVIDRNLNFLNLLVHFCKKAQLRIYFYYSSAIQWCC